MSTRLHTSGWTQKKTTDRISNCIIEKGKRIFERNYKLKKIIYKTEAY